MTLDVLCVLLCSHGTKRSLIADVCSCTHVAVKRRRAMLSLLTLHVVIDAMQSFETIRKPPPTFSQYSEVSQAQTWHVLSALDRTAT